MNPNVQVRGRVRSSCTQLCTRIKELEAVPGDAEVRSYRLRLKDFLSTLSELDEKIFLTFTDEATINTEVDRSLVYKEKLFDAQAHLESLVESPATSRVSRANDSQAAASSGSLSRTTGQRYPPLEIPTFSGKITEWTSFWDLFESLYDSNQEMSGALKLYYLRQFLTGEALAVVDSLGLPVSNESYQSVVQQLKQFYERSDLIINEHINRLHSIGKIKSVNDLKAMRTTLNYITVNIAALKKQQVKVDNYAISLYPVILRSFPEQLVLEFTRKHGVSAIKKSESDIKSPLELFLEFINTELVSRESLRSLGTISYTVVGNNDFQKKSQSTAGGAHRDATKETEESFISSMVATGDDSEQRNGKRKCFKPIRYPCVFCNSEEHIGPKCTVAKTWTLKQRLQKVTGSGSCTVCLKPRHLAEVCRGKQRIKCNTCGGPHFALLCASSKKPVNVQGLMALTGGSEISETFKDDANGSVALATREESTERLMPNYILLETATVVALSPEGSKETEARLLFDSGSSFSYISQDLAHSLKLHVVGHKRLIVHSFFARETPGDFDIVEVVLKGIETSGVVKVRCFAVPVITGDKLLPPSLYLAHEFESNSRVLADRSQIGVPVKNIQILIGSDCSHSIITGPLEVGKSGIAFDTIFGWVIRGPQLNNCGFASTSCLHIGSCPAEKDDLLPTLWELETLGITTDEMDRKDMIQQFKKTIKFDNDANCYEVKLPWKLDPSLLSDNFEIAYNRLQQLLRRLRKHPDELVAYSKAIQELLDEKIAEVKPEDDEVIYVIPHHAVVKTSSLTTTLRVVNDASSRAKGCLSLNDCLEVGPNLLNDLLPLLLNFRIHRVALTGDICKAFLMISVAPSDRNALCFLWPQNPNDANSEIIIYRMTRVTFGVNSSPFQLNATLKTHAEKYMDTNPIAASRICTDMYMDDFLSGASSEAEALTLQRDVQGILKDAGMIMRKWRTNADSIRDQIPETSHTEIKMLVAPVESSAVLGIMWDQIGDNLSFALTSLINLLAAKRDTKRCILQAISRVYDPLGFVTPYVIQMKILLQQLWILKVSWDERIPSTAERVWDRWLEQVANLRQWSIPRRYDLIEDADSYQLHCFVDSSLQAYGVVIYLRSSKAESIPKVCFMASKARVVPLRKGSQPPWTIPRLELMAAYLGAKFTKTLARDMQLKISKVVFWSDSQVVLSWIKDTPDKWGSFVANRVRDIQALTNGDVWNYCHTKDNPADLASRGASQILSKEHSLWWEGPSFLKKKEEMWTNITSQFGNVQEIDKELNMSSLQVVTVESQQQEQSYVVNPSDFSRFRRYVRVLAWILRFIKNIKAASIQQRWQGPLTTEELSISLESIVKQHQMRVFQKEIMDLRDRGFVSTKGSRIIGLGPFLDPNGILRLKGRLHQMSVSYAVKHPILLDSDSCTDLIIRQTHENLAHAGINQVLSHLREEYWILRARSRVKIILNKCVKCRRYKAPLLSEPIAQLPLERLAAFVPFQTTGVDYAGPTYVKEHGGVTTKAWIVLFTCATTRAIHIELVGSLDTASFLSALARFTSRRGNPNVIISDNMLAFKSATRELDILWCSLRHPDTQEYFAKNKISWSFIVERAPWYGGIYERLIRTMKECLRKTVSKTLLNFEELLTVLTEIEFIMNSRPLTTIPSKPEEIEALTPAHFLGIKTPKTLPPVKFPNSASTAVGLKRRWNYRQKLLDDAWKRWRQDYILCLRSAHYEPQVRSSNLKCGEIVLIKEDNVPRLHWKLGRVLEVRPGRDGVIRSCLIKTARKQTLRRPVQLLVRLEIP